MLKTTAQVEKTHIFRIEEDISLKNASKIRTKLLNVIEVSSLELLWLDMANVNFVDSSGIGAIAAVYSLAKRQGCQLVFCRISPTVKLVFEITGLEQVLQFSEQLPASSAD